MRRKLRRLYHDVASVTILTQLFFTDTFCPDCHWSEEVGMDIWCDKHHEKQFMREVRAQNHYVRSLG